ncbi:hypothetical protein [Aquabacterium humicola]|uniref:hypothetical protein n=1 Tax=Aquabacterium humicola TaxID=3237377 RepID=UPI002542FCA5|nr:hypothetical protein [Rubrivivax pictus]
MASDARSTEIPARLLTLMLAASGDGPAIVRRLDELDAFAVLGIGRGRFVDLLAVAAGEFGNRLCDCSWLRDDDRARVDELLESIEEPRLRLQLCRIADDVVGRDDNVANNRRLVLGHAMSRWRIGAAQLAIDAAAAFGPAARAASGTPSPRDG